MNTTYAIRVEGHLDYNWSAWLGAPDMTRESDGATTVTVHAADQAQLHGLLAGLRDIGAVIRELRTVLDDEWSSQQRGSGSRPQLKLRNTA